jgi:hypothetical protein
VTGLGERLGLERPVQAPPAGMDARLVGVAPLYAGECARDIASLVGAAGAVRLLS